ncbi:hypothetical protein EV126DRAFT_79019 [Verticillium dahliae]|nr:hypothetical protein EV126DRAFT_79019 [Verticillium dahliae]
MDTGQRVEWLVQSKAGRRALKSVASLACQVPSGQQQAVAHSPNACRQPPNNRCRLSGCQHAAINTQRQSLHPSLHPSSHAPTNPRPLGLASRPRDPDFKLPYHAMTSYMYTETMPPKFSFVKDELNHGPTTKSPLRTSLFSEFVLSGPGPPSPLVDTGKTVPLAARMTLCYPGDCTSPALALAPSSTRAFLHLLPIPPCPELQVHAELQARALRHPTSTPASDQRRQRTWGRSQLTMRPNLSACSPVHNQAELRFEPWRLPQWSSSHPIPTCMIKAWQSNRPAHASPREHERERGCGQPGLHHPSQNKRAAVPRCPLLSLKFRLAFLTEAGGFWVSRAATPRGKQRRPLVAGLA